MTKTTTPVSRYFAPLPEGAVLASLPNGQRWTATPQAHALAWGWWRAVTRSALSRGEGVSITVVRRDHAAVSHDHNAAFERVIAERNARWDAVVGPEPPRRKVGGAYDEPASPEWEAHNDRRRAYSSETLRLVGEAVDRVPLQDEGHIEISTTYSPQWEGVHLTVSHTGEFCWCGEQSAPEFPAPTEEDRRVPWAR